MAFPIPVFAIDDWATVLVFPTIMAVAFGVFMPERGGDPASGRRPAAQRFVSSFLLYGSVWIPFQIIGDAVERGARAQGFDSPGVWGFGVGLTSGLIVCLALLAISASMRPVHAWLGYGRNPFKSAGKS
ncbi:MAG: hypothetical protein ACK4VY_04375 [Brevundimonas sp.]